MNRQTNHFGLNPGGRPSGIRPPSNYPMGGQNRLKLSSTSSTSSNPSVIPSTASSRKVTKNNNLFNNFGSGGSRASGVGGGRPSTFGSLRPSVFASARKSMTAKLSLFGLTPQHNRTSFQPNTCSSVQSSNRRSSIGGNRHIKDSRPLSEASYQRQCLEKLISFLTTNPLYTYQHPITKTLSNLRPTSKEIATIFEFLFICFGYKGKVLPMEVEIPKAMILLEYPFPVKKSDLVSFTSGRALGSVFGMLEWLVDSLNYGIAMDPIRTFRPNFEGEVDIRTELINICLTANAEDLDSDQTDNLLQSLIVKSFGTEENFEQLVDQQQGLEEEVRRLDSQITEIEDLPQNIYKYETDIKNYEKYIDEMRAHYKTNEETLETLEKDYNEKVSTIKKLEEQRKQIKCFIEEQAFGIEEAVLAKERKQQIEDEIKQECGIGDDIKKSIRGSRLDCNKLEDTLRKMHSDMDSFITAIRDLVDSPVMSSYSATLKGLLSHSDWGRILDGLKNINIETNGSDISELNELFSHRVHELKIAIVQQLSSLQGCVALAEQQKLNELSLMIEEREKQMKNNEKQISQLMSDVETQRKAQVSQIAAHQSECDRNRQLLNEFEGNTNRSHKEEKQNLLDLRKQVEEKELLFRSEHNSMVKEFEESVNSHKKGLQAFGQTLANDADREKSTATRLKAILAKTGSKDSADKEKKSKQKRDKKDKNKNKENV